MQRMTKDSKQELYTYLAIFWIFGILLMAWAYSYRPGYTPEEVRCYSQKGAIKYRANQMYCELPDGKTFTLEE